MISPHDEAVSKQPDDTTSPNPNPADSPDSPADEQAPQNEETSAGEPAAEQPPEDELPEQVELTPEIVEDEAMRNDFMLRLAVVLLAVLFACTHIGETRTLVHIKTGQYLSSHGVLPPRTDVFTHTAEETRWVNLSWLFDLFAAGVYAIGGGVGLTIIKALIAGLTFYLLLIASKREVPSWWASICAGLALIVCADQLTFEPQLITLLGISLTLWIFLRWQHRDEPASLWAFVPVFLVWVNADPRAFLGLVILMLLTLGELLGMLFGRSLFNGDAKRSHLWLIVPICLVAFLVHPFLWQTLLSPASLYGQEYPAWRQLMEIAGGSLRSYLPLTDPAFWQNLTLPAITGLVLAATVPVTFALNWRNVTPAHVLLYLGMLGIAIANSHDLAAASLVFAVLAALNAQEWYLESFRQSYSVEVSERVFSVGGRAVTALAFFGLAFLAITGRLLGSEANRLGFGFRPRLVNLIEGLQKDLKETEIPGAGFNFSLSQGDVLIWLDHKPFIDSRLNLFTPGGSDSLFAQHRRVVEALSPIRPKEEETPEALQERLRTLQEQRQDVFKEHDITYVVLPLGPRIAQYGNLVAMMRRNDEFRMVQLGSMAGWFYRLNPEDPTAEDYADRHAVNFFQQAFQAGKDKEREDSSTELVRDFARPPGWTEKLFLLESRKATHPEALLALHYNVLLTQHLLPLRSMLDPREPGALQRFDYFGQLGMALAHLSIRHAHQALKHDPNSIMAYQALGDSCLRLGQLEDQANQLLVGQPLGQSQRRYLQAVAAFSQATVADPQNANLHRALGNIYEQHNRHDLAIREYERFLELSGPPAEGDERARETYERRLRIIEDIEEQVQEVQKNVDQALENEAPKSQIAAYAHQSGCVLMALRLLNQEEELQAQQSDPTLAMFRANLQLEAGQIEEAYQTLGRLEGVLQEQAGPMRFPQWRDLVAMSALMAGEYNRAITLWTRQVEESEETAMLAVLGTLPLANRPVEPQPVFGSVQDHWATAQWRMGRALVQQMPHSVDKPLYDAALSQLELGRPQEAARLFKELLEMNPDSNFRPLAALYLGLITGESIEVIPPSAFIPTWGDMFAPDPAPDEKPDQQEDQNDNDTPPPEEEDPRP